MKQIMLFAITLLLPAFSLSAQSETLLNKASRCTTAAGFSELKQAAEASADGYADLYLGIALHNMSLTESDRADEAISRLEKIWNSSKSNLALAYLGSARTIRAGSFFTEGKILEASTDLADGIRLIDRACQNEPDNLHIRYLRIINSFALSESSPVPRYEAVREDLDFLAGRLDAEGSELQAFYWYYKGRLALADGDWDGAYTALEKAIAVNSESDIADQAGNLLWELEE